MNSERDQMSDDELVKAIHQSVNSANYFASILNSRGYVVEMATTYLTTFSGTGYSKLSVRVMSLVEPKDD